MWGRGFAFIETMQLIIKIIIITNLPLVKKITRGDSAVNAIIEERSRWKRKEEEENELGEYFGGKRGREREIERSKWEGRTQQV